MGNNESTTNTTYTELTDKKIYYYDSTKFDPAPTIYFEASIKNDNIAGGSQNSGATDCGTGVDDSSIGTDAWSNPQNACATPSNTADVTLTNGTSHYLKATNFGFTLSNCDTIDGIEVTVTRSSTKDRGQYALDNAIRIVKGGTIGSTDRSGTDDWSTSPVTYGGSTDKWGETWTCSDIDNNANFGVAISAKSNRAPIASLDTIQITVYYTTSSGVASTSVRLWDATANAAVTNSEITTTNTNWTNVRSNSIALTSGNEYIVQIKTSDASATARIANAKIILEQTDASGISKTEIIHQYVNTLATDADTTYTEQDYDNEWNPNNWNEWSYAAYLETTIKTSDGTGYASLCDITNSVDITGSELSSVNTSYERQRSSDIYNNLPGSAADLDTQIKNSATDTTSITTSWLIIQLSPWVAESITCLLYTSPSPRDLSTSRMPSSA